MRAAEQAQRFGEPYVSMSWLQVRRIRLWRALATYAEGKWLTANGWRRVRGGWLLPDWHPHKRGKVKAYGVPGFKGSSTSLQPPAEPYDQNHAANSQRKHGEVLVQRSDTWRHKAPAFPPYLRTKPYQPCLVTLQLLLISTQFSFRGHWASVWFLLAAFCVFGVSLWLSHVTRRAWELDWAESRLRGPSNEIHRAN